LTQSVPLYQYQQRCQISETRDGRQSVSYVCDKEKLRKKLEEKMSFQSKTARKILLMDSICSLWTSCSLGYLTLISIYLRLLIIYWRPK